MHLTDINHFSVFIPVLVRGVKRIDLPLGLEVNVGNISIIHGIGSTGSRHDGLSSQPVLWYGFSTLNIGDVHDLPGVK